VAGGMNICDSWDRKKKGEDLKLSLRKLVTFIPGRRHRQANASLLDKVL